MQPCSVFVNIFKMGTFTVNTYFFSYSKILKVSKVAAQAKYLMLALFKFNLSLVGC